MVTLFDAADPEVSQGRELTVREMVDLGARDVREQLSEHPEVQSELMRVLSLVYAGLGEESDGMELAQEAYDQQMTLSDGEPSSDLAGALYAMGVLKDDVGESGESRLFHEQALAMRRALYGNEHLDVAQSLNDLGVTLYGIGKYDSSRVVWEEALIIRESLHADSHRDIAESLSNLGAVYGDLFFLSGFEDTDLFDRAESYYVRAIDMTRRERGEDHPFYASHLHNFGVTLLDRGVLQEAESKFEEAIAKRTLIYGRYHDVTARSINMMGRVRMAQGRLMKRSRISRVIRHTRPAARPPTCDCGHRPYHSRRAGQRRERPSSAINHYLAALDIFQEALPVGNRRIVSAARSVGDLLEGEGRLAEAERYLDLVVDAFDASSPQNATQVGDLINLARVQMQNGRRQVAEGHLAAAETWLAANPNEELSAAIATLRG